MAAPTENLLSFDDLTSAEQNTFIRQKVLCAKKSREMHLQQQWLELKERERVAQQHNRHLLQQFEEAQDTLKDMLARNAAMKTIRMEYERYLETNFPRWQKELQEKTQMAEKKKMEDYLNSFLKKTEREQGSKSAADGPFLSQSTLMRPHESKLQANSTQESFNYNQDRSSQYPCIQSSWLTQTQPQTSRLPVRVSVPSHNPTILSPPNFPYFPPFNHPLASTGRHHHSQSRQESVYWGPSEHNYPWALPADAAGIPPRSWGQFYTEEPPFESRVLQTGKQEDDRSRTMSSKWEKGDGSSSSHFSPELDVKPVRLQSAHAESCKSGRDSRATSVREKRKKERTHDSSSDSERCSSQESSRTSREIVPASVAIPQSSAAETSTEEEHTGSSRRSKRSGGLTAGATGFEKADKEDTKTVIKESPPAHEECGSSSEECMKEKGNQSQDGNTDSCREEQESGSEHAKSDKFKVKMEKQENSSSERHSEEENDEEERLKHPEAGENDKDDEEKDDSEVSAKINTTEEDVETGEDEEDQGDEEESNKLKYKDAEIRQVSASSQDEEEDGSEAGEDKIEDEDGSEAGEDKIEDEDGSEAGEDKIEEEDGSEAGEDKIEEDGGSNEEEEGESEEEDEHRNEEEEADRDSEESIILPQEKSSKQMQVIPEDAAEEEEEECEGGSSDEDVSDEDDVENLLAPHDKSENDGEADGKPKAICHNMDIFQAMDVGSKTDHLSGSGESDHFYD